MCSEGIFVPHSILDQHNGCCVTNNGSERLGYSGLLDGFVDADDVVVVTGCIGGVVDNWIKLLFAGSGQKGRIIPLNGLNVCFP